ncbi:hypothetical protein M422DRAFT_190508 [Sphaerobolus stellatus SS14]|uniref:MFS general substrate transporter n=1 Tax=Sphaerobolus stellatus (strain SS14) TaxID=990650 RepID=A0A0C9UR97_SPHS4|nr:hypothetical protein M422DRAFT_190508 [Sphaerobolus stellatus SS14]
MDPSEAEIVVFEDDDRENPKNWSPLKKKWTMFIAPGQTQIIERYGVSQTLASLGLSLYVLGFAFGPLICPLSEMYGRSIVYFIGWPLLIGRRICLEVIMVFRFFSGFIASVPLTLALSVLSAFTAPVVGPIIGFFVAVNLQHGFWVLRIHFFMLIGFAPLLVFLSETHQPTILSNRAKRLRKAGNPRAYAHHELTHKTPGELVRIALIRPLHMLVTEPIITGAAVWQSLGFGILYFSLEAYPVIFIGQHHISTQLAGLPFIPIIIGMLCAILPYSQIMTAFKKVKIPKWMGDVGLDSKEAVLKLALLSCIFLPASSFWLAWTSGPETHWIVPTLAGALFGYANITLFFTFTTYFATCYTLYTASAGAATAFSRSIIGAIFPLISHIIINRLVWPVSVFGFAAVALWPIPLIYLRWGPELQRRSPYIQEALEILSKMQRQNAKTPNSEQESSSGPRRSNEKDDSNSTGISTEHATEVGVNNTVC